MEVGSGTRLFIVWLVLSALTFSQLAVGSAESESPLTPSAWVSTSAILFALVKVRIILREFMEVRHAPARLRRISDVWVLVTALVLVGSYFIGSAMAAG